MVLETYMNLSATVTMQMRLALAIFLAYLADRFALFLGDSTASNGVLIQLTPANTHSLCQARVFGYLR